GNRQQVLDASGQVEKLDVAAVVPGGDEGRHDRPEAGAVHIGNTAHVQHDVLAALEHETVDLVSQQRVAVAEHQFSVEVENSYRANDALLNGHVGLLRP